LIHFHQSQYRHFKGYYLWYVSRSLKSAFPALISYTRFVALMPSALIPLCVYLQQRKGRDTGLAFIDATSIVVCHNRRIYSHKADIPHTRLLIFIFIFHIIFSMLRKTLRFHYSWLLYLVVFTMSPTQLSVPITSKFHMINK